MTEEIQRSGLCINCLNADGCSYCTNHTNPIIFCEEFTCTEPSVSKKSIDRPIIAFDYAFDPIPKGLCSNCENLITCNLQKTGSNVLNCEEYR